MSLTVVVATRGRPTLDVALRSADTLLPVTELLIVPSPGADVQTPVTRAPLRVLEAERGVYPAWNAAVAAARSSHILFLNDDDRLFGGPLSVLPDDESPTLVLPLRRDDGRRVGSFSGLLGSEGIRTVDLLRSARAGSVNTHLWRRDLFERVGPFRTDLSVRADVEWMHRCARLRPALTRVSTPTYLQGRGPGRLSGWDGDRRLLVAEAVVVAGSISRSRGRLSPAALLARAWVASLRIRAAVGRDRTTTPGRRSRGSDQPPTSAAT